MPWRTAATALRIMPEIRPPVRDGAAGEPLGCRDMPRVLDDNPYAEEPK